MPSGADGLGCSQSGKDFEYVALKQPVEKRLVTSASVEVLKGSMKISGGDPWAPRACGKDSRQKSSSSP